MTKTLAVVVGRQTQDADIVKSRKREKKEGFVMTYEEKSKLMQTA